MHGSVNQKASFYGGYRVGFDYDFYWGLEGRLGASSICLSEPRPHRSAGNERLLESRPELALLSLGG